MFRRKVTGSVLAAVRRWAGCCGPVARGALAPEARELCNLALVLDDEGIGLIPNVASEDRTDHLSHRDVGAGLVDELRQRPFVPSVHEGAEDVDSFLHMSRVLDFPIDGLAAQLADERVACTVCRFECKRDPRGEDRVEELGGIANQAESGAMKPLHRARVPTDAPRFKSEGGLSQPREVRIAGDYRPKALSIVGWVSRECVQPADDAERGQPVAERNDPDPGPARDAGDPDAILVGAGLSLVAAEVREDRLSLLKARGQIELAPIPWTPGLCRQGASAPVGFGVVRASVVVGRVQTS